MTFVEIREKEKAKISTIKFNGQEYPLNLKAQEDFIKVDGKAYALVGSGIPAKLFVLSYIDDDDNVHGKHIPALTYVKVGEAMHKDEFPVYVIANDHSAEKIGTAKRIDHTN